MADSVVPKFSSFKAKPPTPAAVRASHSSEDVEKDRGKSSRPSKRHSEYSPEGRRRHRTASRSGGDTALVRLERKPEPADPQKAPGSLFFIDRRGDPLISRYHANDRAKVPHYRRSGRGRVLGSPGFLVLHREGRHDEFSIRLPGSRPSALKDRHLFNASVRQTKPRRIKPAPVSQGDSIHEDDFVPLSARPVHDAVIHSRSFARDVPSPPGDLGPDYRSIEGKAKAHEFSDSELEYSSSEEAGGIDLSDPMRIKSVELSRRVKERPGDIESWLSLIDHQDSLLRATEGTGGEPTPAEVLSFADIKLSMYESAMGHAETPEQKERLLLGSLMEGSKVWPPAKLERRWDDALKTNDGSFVLWKARLDSRLSNVKAFQYTDIREALLDRIRQVQTQTSYPSSPWPGATWTDSPVALYQQLIYVFLRLTRFIYDSGFRELAVAAWQALLEVNFFRPPNFAAEESGGVLEAFRDFWESEVPRIGERGGQGWTHYALAAAGFGDPPEPRTEANEIVPSRDVYKSWGATERLRAVAYRHPARAMDEGNEDDPYRVVIFADIERLVFLIPTQVIPLVQEALVDAFVLFCDLPLLFGSSEWMKAAAVDTHVASRSLGLEQDAAANGAQIDPAEDQSKRKPDWSHEASQLARSPDMMISKDSWFNYFTEWVLRDKHQGGTVSIQYVIGALAQLGSKLQNETLAEYRLALEWHAEPTLVKKRAKGLLKHFPSSRRLYTTYALAEFANGSADVARQVLTAASAIPVSTITPDIDTLLLWTSRAWMELELGDKTRATICLCAPSDPSFAASLGSNELSLPSAPQLIMVRQTLSSNLGYDFFESKLEEASLCATVLALFEYLTLPGGSESSSLSQGNISAAMDRVWAASDELRKLGASRTAYHEGLLQASSRLLYFHASRGPFRSIFLREQLAKCIKLFPQNAMFLAMYAWASYSFGIEDPAREMLRDVALARENDCLGNRIFAIRYELQRGNAHSVRAAFEKALHTRACSSSAALWRAYVRFCHSRKELRGKAKDVFFRGIAACPWSKDLAMEAFTTLVNMMDEFELRSMYNTMTSKGLRVHVDLDEFVDKMKESRR